MVFKKYINNNNIIHEAETNGIDDIRNLIPNYDVLSSIYQYNEDFINDFNINYQELIKENFNISMRYQKEYSVYGKTPKLNKVNTQNINCYEANKSNKSINIYYDLTNKYNSNNDVNINRFVVTYSLIKKLEKLGYNVNFIPVLFLKAFDTTDNNEYVYIKFNNLSIDKIMKYNLIINNEVSRILLPEIIKHLGIINSDALDYNGYLLERHEKENIIGLKNNDLIIDLFTSDNLFNGKIEHDAKVFYKKMTLKNT